MFYWLRVTGNDDSVHRFSEAGSACTFCWFSLASGEVELRVLGCRLTY